MLSMNRPYHPTLRSDSKLREFAVWLGIFCALLVIAIATGCEGSGQYDITIQTPFGSGQGKGTFTCRDCGETHEFIEPPTTPPADH